MFDAESRFEIIFEPSKVPIISIFPIIVCLLPARCRNKYQICTLQWFLPVIMAASRVYIETETAIPADTKCSNALAARQRKAVAAKYEGKFIRVTSWELKNQINTLKLLWLILRPIISCRTDYWIRAGRISLYSCRLKSQRSPNG